MSGFAGIVNLDGAHVDPTLLDRMARSMAFRGPDAQETWRNGAAGLCHAMLRTTREAGAERQPVALDGRFWIVADARIDARADLVRELHANSGQSRQVSLATPDSELILHAFDTWGDACVEHLLGDFSFAIWDASKQRLFCARDHFGVKPLYYARIGNAFVFSNALDTVRLYPGFSSDLCDEAIADFLIFGTNLHPTRTPFEQILRIPAAHILVACANEIRAERYWSFPIEEPLRYRRSQDYVDQFRELLHSAVQDRLRCDRASVSLSGGLDSPTVAAEAVAQLGAPENLFGITYGFKKVHPDPEPAFAGQVAEYLRVPWHFIAIDDYKPFERWHSSALSSSWPADVTMGATTIDLMDRVAAHGRVLLTGEGGDPGLVPSLSGYRGARVFGLLLGVGKYLLTHGRHPRIGFRVSWQRWRGVLDGKSSNYPQWLEPTLEQRLALRDRWQDMATKGVTSVHPYRPESYSGLTSPWVTFFGTDELCRVNVQVETRHPLFDVRVQRFFLRLPVLPWCADKEILRLAMRDRLPQAILRRPKCPVQGNPMAAVLRQLRPSGPEDFSAVRQLCRYVAQERIAAIGSSVASTDPGIDLRPMNLNYWLSQNIG